MKFIYPLYAILLLFVTSCTEVITLELDTAKQKPVIDATLNATTGTCKVILTKTGGFYQKTDFDKISNAIVSLVDGNGLRYNLSETSTGIYEVGNIKVQPGNNFTLTIENVEGKTYKAEALTPYPGRAVEISKQLFANPATDTLPSFFTSLLIEDYPEVKNYYQMKSYINGKFQASIFDFTGDEWFDGYTVELPSSAVVYEGDTMVLELISMNKAMYQYVLEMSENLELAYNPKTNFDGDVFGRFGIFYSDSKEIKL
ncbi:MAG: DUF4249 domain-containing protein [Saprospiraceae bacterium]|nr:DUF4249 domain-containing protein [Saprospiraceae bacterium]